MPDAKDIEIAVLRHQLAALMCPTACAPPAWALACDFLIVETMGLSKLHISS
jgi:hypothetical protein